MRGLIGIGGFWGNWWGWWKDGDMPGKWIADISLNRPSYDFRDEEGVLLDWIWMNEDKGFYTKQDMFTANPFEVLPQHYKEPALKILIKSI